LRRALIDPLTGVFNRRSFFEFSEKEAARARRGGSMLAVLMADIDHFKRINDNHGHPAGDAVIKELAEVCGRTLRPSDILARYGGEEFVVSLPDTDEQQALIVAERLRAAVEAAAVISEKGPIQFTVSIGVAGCPGHSSLHEAIARADQALYRAKRGGRKRVEIGPPATAVVPGKQAGPAIPAKPMARKLILIVDDEPGIREMLALWLSDSGYAVRTAGNARDALHLVETDPSVSLLVTDIVMPGELNGFDLGRRAEAIRPDLKVVYMSAYATASSIRSGGGEPTDLLQKPFRLSNVLDSVSTALGR
jgi:diguanylate cyclase (GGDEF)-like protein